MKTTTSNAVYPGVPGSSDRGIWLTAFLQAGVASRPSKLTETSSIRTKVRRLTEASNGRVKPPKMPRRPGAPNRKKPSLPQVAKRTEKTSPRRSQVSAPNSAAITALTMPYARSTWAAPAGVVVTPLKTSSPQANRKKRIVAGQYPHDRGQASRACGPTSRATTFSGLTYGQ